MEAEFLIQTTSNTSFTLLSVKAHFRICVIDHSTKLLLLLPSLFCGYIANPHVVGEELTLPCAFVQHVTPGTPAAYRLKVFAPIIDLVVYVFPSFVNLLLQIIAFAGQASHIKHPLHVGRKPKMVVSCVDVHVQLRFNVVPVNNVGVNTTDRMNGAEKVTNQAKNSISRLLGQSAQQRHAPKVKMTVTNFAIPDKANLNSSPRVNCSMSLYSMALAK